MLELRELQRRDLSTITLWRAKRDMIDCLGAPFRYIGPEIDERWFDGYLSGRANCVRCVAVDSRCPNQILGLATLSGIDWIHRSCTFHIMVGPEAQGRGVGKFALTEMLRHAFTDLGLHRVELSVLDSNTRARALYEKSGFVLEGTRRAAVFKNGHWEDMHTMGLLIGEWQALDSSLRGGGAPRQE